MNSKVLWKKLNPGARSIQNQKKFQTKRSQNHTISETLTDMTTLEKSEINRSVDHAIQLLTYKQWKQDLS